jgi:hypothetical protein
MPRRHRYSTTGTLPLSRKHHTGYIYLNHSTSPLSVVAAAAAAAFFPAGALARMASNQLTFAPVVKEYVFISVKL